MIFAMVVVGLVITILDVGNFGAVNVAMVVVGLVTTVKSISVVHRAGGDRRRHRQRLRLCRLGDNKHGRCFCGGGAWFKRFHVCLEQITVGRQLISSRLDCLCCLACRFQLGLCC